jgi:hypothetical protein
MQKELSAADVLRKFEASGFQVTPTTGERRSLEVKKNGFTRRLELDASGAWIPVGYPLFNVRGLDCELEDHGYQKFWYHQGKRVPAHLKELKTLHQFEEEVRYILGLKSLYHESLGSTSARTVYDRVEGRPDPLGGDVA